MTQPRRRSWLQPRFAWPRPAPPTHPYGGDPSLTSDYSETGFAINFGYVCATMFTPRNAGTVTGFQFVVWMIPGESYGFQTVDYAIGVPNIGPYTGTARVSLTFLLSNRFGYDIYLVTVTDLSVPVDAGAYTLTLQNASSVSDGIYWDINNRGNSYSTCDSQWLADIDSSWAGYGFTAGIEMGYPQED